MSSGKTVLGNYTGFDWTAAKMAAKNLIIVCG